MEGHGLCPGQLDKGGYLVKVTHPRSSPSECPGKQTAIPLPLPLLRCSDLGRPYPPKGPDKSVSILGSGVFQVSSDDLGS